MSTPSAPLLSQEDDLSRERVSETKHEYLAGRMFSWYRDAALAGAPERHHAIRENLRRELALPIDEEHGRLLVGEVNVNTPAGQLFHPDICIVCESSEGVFVDGDVLVNPCVLMEIMRPTSDADDRSERFRHY